MDSLGKLALELSDFVWGMPLLVLFVGGGLYFMLMSSFRPIFYIRHTIDVLRGKFDNANEQGQINHFQALSTAIAGTVGMGNVAGVAIAITTGGPGAIFWMWVSAFLGIFTNFYTISLALMFRGKDDQGQIQGGPMYVISEGLGKNWRWLGILFSLFAMIGIMPMFNVNQLTRVINMNFLAPIGLEESLWTNLTIGVVLAIMVSAIALGGIKRIARSASLMVPFMVLFYFVAVFFIVFSNYQNIIPTFTLIFHDAFNADSVLGGSLGALIVIGARRGAFSNEAGLGTAAMAYGATKTDEPIREGLVSMLTPIIDTIVVCTLTALAILISGQHLSGETNGIMLTMATFENSFPGYGSYILSAAVFVFSFTTLFAFPYYGIKSFSYVFGTKYSGYYNAIYILSIPMAAVVSLDVVLGIVDSAYGLMAFPTMISGIILAPKVNRLSKGYFSRFRR